MTLGWLRSRRIILASWPSCSGLGPMRRFSSSTSRPRRSQASRNSGVGGFVRATVGVHANLLQPGNAEGLQRVGQRHAHAGMVLVVVGAVDLDVPAVEEEAVVGVETDGGGCQGRLVTVHQAPLARMIVTSRYSAGDSSDQSRGCGTLSPQGNSPVEPASTKSDRTAPVAISRPSGSTMLSSISKVAASRPSLATVVRAVTLAAPSPSSVVTYVPPVRHVQAAQS